MSLEIHVCMFEEMPLKPVFEDLFFFQKSTFKIKKKLNLKSTFESLENNVKNV